LEEGGRLRVIGDGMSDSARVLVLFEEMNGKFDAILEYVRDIPDIRRRVMRTEDKMDILQDDVTMVKGVIKEHSRILRN
jgi:type IV secretory pathway ATPase VirB11/archaellum biosynthesis ATPase